ncbi:ABC transporter permease [Bosea sp. BK604]|uniref:ABC transporter permease n=1 Tax=Bosea sp. BK604 TaxID=2512180 RepID=UPI0010D62E37|nr:ABC transporter permease [Bosea sp. BK604]TCR64593.1 multiple sugar transport system permease protein/putative spermidine/putrescine transport system permease protein [Bosea sp. BK604]
MNRRAGHIIAALLSLYALIALVIPLVVAMLWSLVNPQDGWFAPDLVPPSYSTSFWSDVFATPGIPAALLRSVGIAIVVTALTVTLALPTAWALARIPFRAKRAVEVFILAPLIVPGIIVAVSLTEVFIRLGLFGSLLGVILVQTVGTLPLMIRILTASLEGFPVELVWAARTLGASPGAAMRRIVIPMTAPGVVAGGLLSFISSFEEFEKTFMIGAPAVETIATKLWSYLGGDIIIFPTASVVTFILLVPTVIIFAIAQALVRDEDLAAGMGKV